MSYKMKELNKWSIWLRVSTFILIPDQFPEGQVQSNMMVTSPISL